MKNLAYKIRSYIQSLMQIKANSSLDNDKKSTSKQAYFFTHVPKTGGTSLIATLDRFFPVNRIFPHQLWWEVNDTGKVRAQDYDFFRGHFGGGAADLLTNKEVLFFTVLRNPIKLAYSTYQHVLRDQNTQVHDLVINKKLDFEAFLSHPKTSHLASNRIVHNFCYGENNQIDKHNTVINEKSFKIIRKHLNPIHNGLSEEDCFKKSIEFIDKTKWFGILEHFDKSLDLLCYTMVWPPVGQTAKLNTNKKPAEISVTAKLQAAKINNHDFQLYEYALKVFNEKYQKMLTNLGVDPNNAHHKVSELIDQHYQDYYLKAHNVELKSSVTYTVADIILGSQWHQREWSFNHRSYYCWSGPGNHSFIDFWMIPKDYHLTIKILNVVDKNFLKGLVIKINNHTVSWKQHIKGSYHELSINCLKNMIKPNGLLRISFIAQTQRLTPGLLQSDDDRNVGFALSGINIYE
ncbi:MAG: hypothetical protein DWP95_03195 [Proteobacteria bacterium]|nr:MAG: hypothetical protein DWP95_03195 [Pseudomonadota bacterium]